jgi:cardiolipin synthase
MNQTQWLVIAEVLYVLVILAICIRIIYDTKNVSKTLAYLLLVIFVPILGSAFYFSFGINYRKRKIYSKKLNADDTLIEEYRQKITQENKLLKNTDNLSIVSNFPLIRLLTNPKSGIPSPLLPHNEVKILVNGEELFPLVLEKLKQAKKHIHIEYYIYEDDTIGNQIKDILIEKVKEGVDVRFIYDDFGSKGIRRGFVKVLKKSGVQAFPFNKIKLIRLANRLNYRNHRKIVIIDGETSFVGGINVSDKYINPNTAQLYWRDTHLMIQGYGTHALQQIFLADWNFCSHQNLSITRDFFPELEEHQNRKSYVQMVHSGPDSENPAILYSVLQAIQNAKNQVLITTPYYIPDDSLQQTLILTALRGVDVQLLVPKKGDSFIVDIASQAYFKDLLKAGVKVYRYTKGFVHAKTMVIDTHLISVGTANFDLRSFDLNFEVSAFVYDEEKAIELANIYAVDASNAEELSLNEWKNRPKIRTLLEQIIRLLSPLL